MIPLCVIGTCDAFGRWWCRLLYSVYNILVQVSTISSCWRIFDYTKKMYLEFFRWTWKVLCLNASLCISEFLLPKPSQWILLPFPIWRSTSTIFKWIRAKHTHTHTRHTFCTRRAFAQNFHFILMKKTWLFKHSWHMETITINITVAETTKTTTFVRPKFS